MTKKPPTGKKPEFKAGVDAVAEMMNLLDDAHRAKLMENVAARDPELAKKIKDKMFVFEDFAKLTPRALQTFLQKTQGPALALALRGMPQEFQATLFSQMSKRAAEALKEEIQSMGPQLMSKVTEAQKKLIDQARQLEAKGELALTFQRPEEKGE